MQCGELIAVTGRWTLHFGFDVFGHILGGATLSRGGRFWRGFADVAHATLPEPGIYVWFPGILVVWDPEFGPPPENVMDSWRGTRIYQKLSWIRGGGSRIYLKML